MNDPSKRRKKYGPGPTLPEENKETETATEAGINIADFAKKEKKSFTLVRIEDDIVEDFREIVRIYKLESHGPLMNQVLREYAKTQIP